jgi:hypothetical protein
MRSNNREDHIVVGYGKKWFAGVAVVLTAGGLSMGLAPLANAAPTKAPQTIGATANTHGQGSSAMWNKFGNAATLRSGNSNGAFAELDLVKPPMPSTNKAPTLTGSSAKNNSPRWVIQFHNGASIWGTLPNSNSPKSTLSWWLEPGNHHESSWSAALSAAHAGKSNPVTAAYIEVDNAYANTSVTVSNMSYNGWAVVRYVKPVKHPYLYGGHVITVNNNRAEIGWKDGPGVHYVLTKTFGYGFSKNGAPQFGFTGGTVGYWSGLAAGHTYDIELIPASANRQPLPHAVVGWINIVTTR